MVQELAGDNLSEIIKKEEKVVAQFILSWDDNCQAVNQDFIKIATEFSDVTFITVDIEKNPESSKLITAEVYPSTTFFVGGNVKAQTRTKKIDALREFITENN